MPGDIPCTGILADSKIQGDYEDETGNSILECFQKLSYNQVQMVLVARHGPFTWGETPEKAIYNSVMIEQLAKMALLTTLVDHSIQPMKTTYINKHFDRKHGSSATYGQK